MRLEGGGPRVPVFTKNTLGGIFIGTCVLSRSTQAAAARSLGFQKSPGSPVAGPCIISVELASLWPPGTHRNRFERQGKRHRNWGRRKEVLGPGCTGTELRLSLGCIHELHQAWGGRDSTEQLPRPSLAVSPANLGRCWQFLPCHGSVFGLLWNDSD